MNTLTRPFPEALLALLALPLAAQAAPPDLTSLARSVGAAHRPDGPTAKVEAFRCSLELAPREATPLGGQRAELRLASEKAGGVFCAEPINRVLDMSSCHIWKRLAQLLEQQRTGV